MKKGVYFSYTPAPRSMPLSFEVTLLGATKLTVDDDAVDLEKRTVCFRLDRPPREVRLRVVGEDGATIDDRTIPLPAAPAGEPVAIAWDGSGRVMRIDLRAADEHGYYQDVELYPWRFDVPHEDVHFDTGRAEIVPAERPKLEAAWAELSAAIGRYGRFAKIHLFVRGHTDTVGDAESNRALSEARARAIAAWFRARGAKLPISFAGAGESSLLVGTPDETAEARNRRAEYVVSVTPPPGVSWTRLP